MSPSTDAAFVPVDMRLIAQQPLEHLAVRVTRQHVDESEPRRTLKSARCVRTWRGELVRRHRARVSTTAARLLAVALVRDAEHRAVDDRGMGMETSSISRGYTLTPSRITMSDTGR